MASTQISTVNGENIADAWLKAIELVYNHPMGEASPLIVSFPASGLLQIVTHPVYIAVDRELVLKGENSIHTTANTIFPISLWNARKDRTLLFERYKNNLKHIRKDPANRRGIYFERLVAYGDEGGKVNQLEHIITTWERGNHRRSALQAQIFDPTRDHIHSPMLGFPCLDQIVFSPIGTSSDRGLKVTGVYAMQYIFEKAFGNYLGLARLGEFMGHEMKLPLKEVTCIACTAKLGNKNKKDLAKLMSTLAKMNHASE